MAAVHGWPAIPSARNPKSEATLQNERLLASPIDPSSTIAKAALFEFLSTAAGTWIVPTDALKRILKASAASALHLGLSSRPLLVHAILLTEAVPFRQLVDCVTEKGVFMFIRTPGLVEALDAPSEILLEMVEC